MGGGGSLRHPPSAFQETADVLDTDYHKARDLSRKIASEMDPPLFYVEKRLEVALSEELFETHDMVRAALHRFSRRADRIGHGLSHVRKVALDAGAVVLCEAGNGRCPRTERQVLLAHLAGVLHDIRREERNHALRGAEEAGLFLSQLALKEGERRAVVQAIRNHEAFKPFEPLDDPGLQIVSDALYDADKFRWGPDNFTDTVWSMVASRNVPLETLLDHFLPGMEGIGKIRDTFRTPTGRTYGPDFIEKGLQIGKKIYELFRGASSGP